MAGARAQIAAEVQVEVEVAVEAVQGKIKCPNCKVTAKETYTAEKLKEHDAHFHKLQEKNKSNSWKLPPPPVQSEVDKAMRKKDAKKLKTDKRSLQATQARIARLDNIP